VPKLTLMCHPEAKPKDLANEREILRFAQNDSLAVTLGILDTPHFSSLSMLWHINIVSQINVVLNFKFLHLFDAFGIVFDPIYKLKYVWLTC